VFINRNHITFEITPKETDNKIIKEPDMEISKEPDKEAIKEPGNEVIKEPVKVDEVKIDFEKVPNKYKNTTNPYLTAEEAYYLKLYEDFLD
jgi:hypothetical protein